MSAVGSGYDLSVATYSRDGRVYQVEYAAKAVENSGTAIGIRCKEGVVVAVEKVVASKMLVPGTNRRVMAVDLHAGMAVTGLLADVRQVVKSARKEAKQFRQNYARSMPSRLLNDHVQSHFHYYTLYGYYRPYGVQAIVASWDEERGPDLHMVEPSGLGYGYWACAAGKGAQAARNELEKLDSKEMTMAEAVEHAARIIHTVHDESKDKLFELEMGWICAASERRFEMVPKDVLDDAEAKAKAALESDDEDSDEDMDA